MRRDASYAAVSRVLSQARSPAWGETAGLPRGLDGGNSHARCYSLFSSMGRPLDLQAICPHRLRKGAVVGELTADSDTVEQGCCNLMPNPL
jgi:hypothetical protein